MLIGEVKKQYHSKIAKYYRTSMDNDYTKGNGVLYEDIMKWGYHLENSSILTDREVKLINMEPQYLDALWAIERFGFPFAYSDLNCIEANQIVENLLDISFIKINDDESNRYMLIQKRYKLKDFNFFELNFIIYLCLSREISNHLGYITNFKPNEAYDHQGICCPWEHCVEYMPLPPLKMTKLKYEERIIFLKQMFESGAYDEKSEEIREVLLEEITLGVPEDAPDENDKEIETEGCPIFGHYCPGGKEQATICRSLDFE